MPTVPIGRKGCKESAGKAVVAQRDLRNLVMLSFVHQFAQLGLKSGLPRRGQSDQRVSVAAEPLLDDLCMGKGTKIMKIKGINLLQLPVEEGRETTFLHSLFPLELSSLADKIILFEKTLRSEPNIHTSSFRSP